MSSRTEGIWLSPQAQAMGGPSKEPLTKIEMLTTEQVGQFVRNGMFELTAQNRMQARCVDGRYNGESQKAARSMPGGDAGMLMIGLAAARELKGSPLVPKERAIINKELKGFLKEERVRFAMHTDNHHEDDGTNPACGCGHCNKCFESPEEYKLGQKDVLFVQTILSMLNVDEKAVLHELEGAHQERAVIVMRGNKGLMSKSTVDGLEAQAFVLQADLQNEALDKYANKLAVQLRVDLEIMKQKVYEVAQVQLQATLSKIAQGVPIYEAVVDKDGNVTVTKLS